MILSEDDIIILVENYKNKYGFSQEKMAELCGMAGASTYNKWVNKITDGGKIRYLLNFLKNTKQPIVQLFPNGNNSENNNTANEPEVTTYSCPDCIEKQKEIDMLRKEKDEIKNKYIICLEQLAGNKGGAPLATSA